MIELSRDSKLVKWAYLLDSKSELEKYDVNYSVHPPVYNLRPVRTSLCAIFWRTVLLTPLAIVAGLGFVIAGGVLIISVLAVILKLFMAHKVIVLSATLGLLLAGALIAYKTEIEPYFLDTVDKAKSTVLVQGFKAVKGKVCPVVEIK